MEHRVQQKNNLLFRRTFCGHAETETRFPSHSTKAKTSLPVPINCLCRQYDPDDRRNIIGLREWTFSKISG